LACAFVTLIISAAAHAGQRSDVIVLDAGAYTTEQAERGQADYRVFCAQCHGLDLNGTLAADTGAPPLHGAPFVLSMEKKGLAAVFDYVKTTMPADEPGSLQESEYVDILAFLIQANGFPAGGRELMVADLPRVTVRRPSTR
jgi:cytochrome c